MQPEQHGINFFEYTYHPFRGSISLENIAIDKHLVCRRYTTNGSDDRKNERHDDKHLERGEKERLMSVQIVANHVSWPPEQFTNGTQHGPRTKAPNVEETLHNVFECQPMIVGL